MSHEGDAEELLTVQEFADRFRVHVQTVYTAIRNNRLRFDVIRPADRVIRIRVPRESIPALKHTE